MVRLSQGYTPTWDILTQGYTHLWWIHRAIFVTLTLVGIFKKATKVPLSWGFNGWTL
jgi:hypothetical protein